MKSPPKVVTFMKFVSEMTDNLDLIRVTVELQRSVT